MNRKNNRTGLQFKRYINAGKRAVARVLSFVTDKWNSLQRETKKAVGVSVATGLVLVIAIIVLAVRLGSVTRELDSVHAMSTDLREELTRVTTEMEAALQKASVTEALQPTSAPVLAATATPMPTVTPEQKRYVVCLDAGHGDWDGGATLLDENNRDIRVEKEDNLWMAKLLEDALKVYDVDVVLTRETDVYLGLTERTDIANREKADVLISFHRNSVAVEPGEVNNEVTGAEIWVHNSKPQGAVVLAEELMQIISRVGGMRNRGVKYGTMNGENENYAVNRYANMTSMLIEYGFVTSSADNEAYDKNGIACAEAMAKAIYEWLLVQDSNR